MSPGDNANPADPKSFPGLGLDFAPSAANADADTDAHMNQSEAAALQALKLETSEDAMGTMTASHDNMGDAHFGDFGFPYQNSLGDSPMVGLHAAFDEHGQDVYGNSEPSMQEHQNPGPSITVHTSGYGDHGGQRQSSMDDSDDGTPDSNDVGGNSLEEPMSDEFGLARGPADGTDMGGKKGDKADQTPAWSELKTKAGKERKRLPLACIACRRKKIRCSGEKPACKHCLRSRIPCVYKVTARKAAPRTDYMAMLDKRLKRMEERIIKIVPKAEQDALASSVTRAVVKPAIPGSLGAAKPAAVKKRGADEAFGPDLDHWARAPAKSKLDSASKPSTILVQEAEESKLLLEGGDALPSKELQEHLAEVFFENIYGQAYHILHKPSFMRKLKAGALPPVLVLSVCAIAARFSNHPKLNTNPNFLRGEEWASAARDILTKRYEWPNITILTCLLILGLHEFGTCHGGRSWSLGGQAIRMAFALQLHKDLEHDPLRIAGKTQLSFIDREIRRRTMWACFLMDRFNSSGTDRPTFIREETLKIPLPIREKNFQFDMPGPTETLSGHVPEPFSDMHAVEARENMGVAAWMIKVIALWGRIIGYLNQGGKELDPHHMWSPESQYSKLIKQTDDLAVELPDSLAYTPENLHLHETDNMANQFLFLHISLQQNILFMNRFAVSPPNGSTHQDVPKSFVTKAGAKAFAAANRISELLKDAESHFITAPFTGYCAFLSSTVHIFGIFSGNATMEATSKRNLATNVKYLSKMKRYWGMFHWMSENLRDQYRTCADAARQGTPANDSSTIFQYGDWFDRYPYGVSQSDFLDPATYKKKERGDDAVLEQKPELHTVEEFFTTLSPQQQQQQQQQQQNQLHPTDPNPHPSTTTLQQRQQTLKRKAMARKASSTLSRSDHGGDLNTQQHPPAPPDYHARLHQHTRTFSNGSPNSPFNPLSIIPPHSAAYHATMSPVSPVSHLQQQHPSFFPPGAADPFTLALGPGSPHPSTGSGGGMSQLDRQLVFGGAYGGDGVGVAGWPSTDERGRHHQLAMERRQQMQQQQQQQQAQHEAAALHHHQHGGHQQHHHGHHHGGGVFGGAGGESSSAWFMPFNMEPPEIGGEGVPGGLGLDGLAGLFGGGGGGGMGHGR